MRFICCFLVLVVLGLSFSLSVGLRVDYENVNWADMRDKAVWVGNLVQQNKDLARKVPTLAKFFKDVASNAKLLSINPAVAASTIYMTGMFAAMYYYSLEAESQLRQAQFKDEDIKLIIETEIIPRIQFLEKVFSRGNLAGFCRGKVKESFKTGLGETANSLKAIREDIYAKIDKSSAGSTTNGILQGVSVVGGAVAIGVMAAAPCVGTAFLACPQALAGAASLGSSLVGFGGFTYNKLTHKETLSLLNTTRLTVYEAEKVCRMTRTAIETTCTDFALNDGMVDVNNMMKELDTLIPKKETPQLEHQHHDEDPSENGFLNGFYYYYNHYYNGENKQGKRGSHQ